LVLVVAVVATHLTLVARDLTRLLIPFLPLVAVVVVEDRILKVKLVDLVVEAVALPFLIQLVSKVWVHLAKVLTVD
jgi:hypothetical protein